MQTPAWYFHRLRRMSIAETSHRLARAGRDFLARLDPTDASVEPYRAPSEWPKPWIAASAALDATSYRLAADRLRAGRHTIFDLHDVDLGSPPQWNRDPLTGRVAPLTRATRIDYRDESVVGNIKYLWEPNRHLHLVPLAQAFALTGDEAYLLEIRRQVGSWLVQCPYPQGPNWASSLELGIRLINWSLCWQLVGGERSPLFAGADGQRFRAAWLDSVCLHVRAIMRNLSGFSSANNHLIGEAAGVVVAAATWPCWPSVTAAGERCRRILHEEALKQNAPDGGNREQAISYQQFVLDFLLAAGLATRATGRDFPPEYWDRIEAMIDFVAAMMDSVGQVPMIGDADDGYVLRLSPMTSDCPYRSLVATGAVLFDRPDFAAKAGTLDHKSRWLLGAAADDGRFQALAGRDDRARTARRALPDSGYFILGDGLGTPREVRLLVDAGPLGYLSLAAHGHADALSIVLNVGGHEILVDPGTFCYHTLPDWRRYFRGTSAHNTVSVDGLDQSVQRGNFMWSDHAAAWAEEFQPESLPQVFVGAHGGYRRLRDPVLHRREIRYDPGSREFEIRDVLSCSDLHEIVRHWHFSEHLQPEIMGGTCTVRTRAATVVLSPLEPLQDFAAMYGSESPTGGWVSRSFGRKVPAHTVNWRNRIHGETVLRTRIACRFN